ncbi:MAG TPA: ABC transporter permease [Elusimicrobiota bacterium]|jgi:peptide/nickel transport system permease protein|nr:ABC transporter permease [Elusimicrobiota bacterium]HMU95739.1 ABC transporter permease [Elusimicrobiota bacterium]HMX43254.1 ABC transporter permease [Elusimicrobiota bacterium]HND64018.1 ABC transporter permease [Elusimicrobiota bacterium]HNF59561.1 ABC transporter permease [Elusimicrobiota bacterium]
MGRYFLRRLLLTVPLLLGITLISFLVMRLAPGGPTDMATTMNMKASTEARARLVKLYGLDKPLPVQYGLWLSRLARLDFGNSFRDDRPVLPKIGARLPATLALNVLSLLLIFLVAVPLGVWSAVRQNSIFDRSATLFVFIGYSVPTFWLSLLLMIFFGLKLGWLPISGLRSLNYDDLSAGAKGLDLARHLALPVFVSAFTGLAGLSRFTRNGTLEVIRQDYIRTARAKGLSEGRVIFKHALRNALIPVVTILGLSLPDLIGGSFIFETIFAYPGMGRLGFDAVMARDYPVVMAVGTIAALLTLLGNFAADLTYAAVDPRIRFGR